MDMPLPFPPDYLLLDGAVIAGTSVFDDLTREGIVRAALYADEGDQAAAVGPWLLASDARSIAIVSPLLQTAGHRIGVGLLKTSASFDQVNQHLVALRCLYARSQRFYFRYADLRAFDNLWQVLRAEQQTALLGPITQWAGWPWGEWPTHYAAPAPAPALDEAMAALPLRLGPPQFARLTRLQRDDERLTECLALEPDSGSDRDMPALRAISQRTGLWLQSAGIDAYAVAVAVGIQALRTDGAILDSAEFRRAVAAVGDGSGDASDLLAWPHLFDDTVTTARGAG